MRISDWSSDVCSSDLLWVGGVAVLAESVLRRAAGAGADIGEPGLHVIGRAGAVVVGAVAQRGGGEVAQRAGVDLGIRRGEIGRASCRGRVCQYVEVSGVGGSLKKTKTTILNVV